MAWGVKKSRKGTLGVRNVTGRNASGKLAPSFCILSLKKATKERDTRNNLLMTPRLTIFNLCTQAGLSRCKHWLSLPMPSSVSTPTCLRHLSKSSHHPTCSGIVTQLMCHLSGFWLQNWNLTHPESAFGKPSPRCACIHAPEIGYHHPITPPKGTA